MKKVLCVFCVMLLFGVLLGCNYNGTNYRDEVLSALNTVQESEEIVYDISINNFACFSMSEKTIKHYEFSQKSKFQNVFAYHSAELGEYYTIGDSVEGEFKIIRLQPGGYELIHESKKREEALFPIAQNQKYAFFATEKETGRGISSEIAYLTEGNNVVCANTTKMNSTILDGAISKQWLYFTVYKDDTTFELYKWNYQNPDSLLILERKDLISSEIYCYENTLYYYTEETLDIGTVSLPMGSTVYMKENILLLFDVTASGKYNCSVYDLKKDEKVRIIEGAQAFSLEAEAIHLYLISGQKEVIEL